MVRQSATKNLSGTWVWKWKCLQGMDWLINVFVITRKELSVFPVARFHRLFNKILAYYSGYIACMRAGAHMGDTPERRSRKWDPESASFVGRMSHESVPASRDNTLNVRHSFRSSLYWVVPWCSMIAQICGTQGWDILFTLHIHARYSAWDSNFSTVSVNVAWDFVYPGGGAENTYCIGQRGSWLWLNSAFKRSILTFVSSHCVVWPMHLEERSKETNQKWLSKW